MTNRENLLMSAFRSIREVASFLRRLGTTLEEELSVIERFLSRCPQTRELERVVILN